MPRGPRNVGSIRADGDDVFQVGKSVGDGGEAFDPSFIDDDGPHLGLIEEVGEEVALVADVDGHLDEPAFGRSHPCGEELGGVVEHDRHRVALGDAEGSEPVCEPVRCRVEIAERDAAFLERDEGAIGVLRGAGSDDRPQGARSVVGRHGSARGP